MPTTSAAALFDGWDPGSRHAPHRRLKSLLAVLHGAREIAADTLGARNIRLLELHRDLVGKPLEATVTCGRCAVESEFEVPAHAILAIPTPDPAASAVVRCADQVLRFRLPRMDDIQAAAHEPNLPRALLERCQLESGPISESAMAEAGRAFELLDPAANLVIDLVCAGCARPIAASLEIAGFVARDLDALSRALFHDVDRIAAAYGWTERDILALPPARRRRYVTMIEAASTPRVRSTRGVS